MLENTYIIIKSNHEASTISTPLNHVPKYHIYVSFLKNLKNLSSYYLEQIQLQHPFC